MGHSNRILETVQSTGNQQRKDFLGHEVVYVPNRRHSLHIVPRPTPTPYSPDCAFCPGNEHKTSGELLFIPNGSPATWAARVVENKYETLPGHEVLVEMPEHSGSLATSDRSTLRRYLTAMQQRLLSHAKNKSTVCTSIFKNEGKDSAASQEHPHTQLQALRHLSPDLKVRMPASRLASDCQYCHLLGTPEQFPPVLATASFALVSPFVARFPYEMWLLPKSHTPSLTTLTETEIDEMAGLLGASLRAQDLVLSRPAYNLFFHMAPHGTDHFHFSIEIVPRITILGGSELGSELFNNPVPSEIAAREYRMVLAQMNGQLSTLLTPGEIVLQPVPDWSLRYFTSL